jgi:hypothetical protein
MKQILTYILFIFIFTSCEKDSSLSYSSNANDCQELPGEPITGWNYLFDSGYTQFPYFNPNNSDEIIFQKKNYSTGNLGLYKYNLVTHQKQLVYAGENWFPPKWGRNDWILLNPPDANIWKIKSNGDSLTQLTFTSNNFYPEWNLDATKFAYANNSLNKTFICSPDGTVFDTLDYCGVGVGSCWQHPTLIVGAGVGLTIGDPYQDTFTWLFQQQEPPLNEACWLNDYVNIIYTATNGIFKINSQTKQITLIKSSCFTKNYLFLTYSTLSNKMIFQRVDQRAINSTTVEVKSGLYIMNADGTDEREIIIE